MADFSKTFHGRHIYNIRVFARNLLRQICVLVSMKLSLLFALLLCHCLNNYCLPDTTIRYSAYNRNSSVRTQLVTRLLELQLTVVCSALPILQSSQISQTNVLEMEGSYFRRLENSIATACICAFSRLSVPHACCCCHRRSMYLLVCICLQNAVRLYCVCVIHLSHNHPDVIVGWFTYKQFDEYMGQCGFCFILFM